MAPLRFLFLVIAGWIGVRVMLLIPWNGDAPPVSKVRLHTPASRTFAKAEIESVRPETRPAGRSCDYDPPMRLSLFTGSAGEPAIVAHPMSVALAPSERDPDHPAAPQAVADPSFFSRDTSQSRWSASAWLFTRRGNGTQLATAGTLGGSQLGGRVAYRLNRNPARPLSLSARLYAPLRGDGAEAALGIEWKPLRTVPIHVLAERRQAIDEDGRSAFSLLAYGGVGDRRIAGPLLLDAYAQAGVVGVRSRDTFADGMASLGVRLTPAIKAGVGMWAAAQPGVSRVDIGPQLSSRLPLPHGDARLTVEWRVRIAGRASPGSGPAVTLSTDF